MAFKNLKTALCGALLPAVSAALLLSPACAAENNKIKLSLGIWRGSSAAEREYYEECKRAFEKSFPEYELVYSPYEYSEDTVVAKYASGQLPTLFEADASLVKGALRNGYIRDVSASLRDFGWLDKADDYFLSQISEGGRVCGVPAEQYSVGMVLKLPLLYEAGVIGRDRSGKYNLYSPSGRALYPDTFDKLAAAVADVVNISGHTRYGIFLPSGDERCGRLYADMIYSFGAERLEYTDADGRWRLSLGQDSTGGAMRWVRLMSQERYADISERFSVEDWASAMAEDRAAVAFCQSNELYTALAAEPALNGQIAFVPMPVANGAKSRAVWNGKVYAVSGRATDEQVRGAFEFLKFMGYGPDADAQSLRYIERRFAERFANGISVFPPLSVWRDGEYAQRISEIFIKYKNTEEEYYRDFYYGFHDRKAEGEPHARDKLHLTINGLFSKMLYEATTSDVVRLISESEAEFTEAYLSKIKGAS